MNVVVFILLRFLGTVNCVPRGSDMAEVRLDEIGYWSQVKLEIVRKYAAAYSQIMAKQSSIRGHVYVDAFAGAGVHVSRQTGECVPGSPLNALELRPAFSEYHLIDMDGGRAANLRAIIGSRSEVHVHEGDCNEVLLTHVLPRCQYKDYRRALCLLDPYGLNVDWRVLKAAGSMNSVEVFYNFMIMDVNMNVLHRNPDSASEAQRQRLDAVWGDRSWRDIAYAKTDGLFGSMETKLDNTVVAEAFRKRLQDVAGFKFVPPPMPMRNSKGAVVYYLFFASPNKTGGKIVAGIFDQYRNKEGA